MASPYAGFLAVADAFRSISGPSAFDIRRNQLTITTRTWTGPSGRVGDTSSSDSNLVLPAYYPIRFMTEQEVSQDAGRYEMGDVLVDHVTPSNGAGVGFTPLQLNPDVTADNVEVIYTITGPLNGDYSLVDGQFHRPFSYRLVLRRRSTRPHV